MPAFAPFATGCFAPAAGRSSRWAVATNMLAALAGLRVGWADHRARRARAHLPRARDRNLSEPSTPHRVLVIGAGTLDSLPDNGAVVTLLAVCGSTHRERDHDIVMVGIVGALIGLVAVILFSSALGSF